VITALIIVNLAIANGQEEGKKDLNDLFFQLFNFWKVFTMIVAYYQVLGMKNAVDLAFEVTTNCDGKVFEVKKAMEGQAKSGKNAVIINGE
jgi:hypothetical protein